MIKQLELSLYRSARCLDEYADNGTLKSRMQELAGIWNHISCQVSDNDSDRQVENGD